MIEFVNFLLTLNIFVHLSVAPQDPYFPPSETGSSDTAVEGVLGGMMKTAMKTSSPESQPRVKLGLGF